MNLDLSEDQRLMRESFARFLDHQSSMARVRAAAEQGGFDADMWSGLAELGALSLRVPEAQGGLGLGVMDAAVLMEEAGRTLASGPLAESLVAARAIAVIGGKAQAQTLEQIMAGELVASIALADIAERPLQWVAGGAVADVVVARKANQIVLVRPDGGDRAEPNLASTPLAELDLGTARADLLGAQEAALHSFERAVEEWKLLTAIALNGLAREAVRLAAAYACEREAFDQPIGTYQAISHPLADLITDIDGGKFLTWQVVHAIGAGLPDTAPRIPMSLWWNADTAARAVSQALHTFGGYGLSTEYDIHLYNLRAKDMALVWGDPIRLLDEAGDRQYGPAEVALPEVGAVSIDFDLGADAQAMADELNDLLNAILTPELRAKAHYSFDGFDAGVHKKVAQSGLLFPAWPERLGGRAAPPYVVNALSKVWEDQGWSTHATATTQMVGTMIDQFGSDALKSEALTRIVAGEAICSLGYSEPGCGSDVFAARTRATRDGDGWRIDGSKMFTSGANIAQYVLLLTRTNFEVPKHRGLTMFVVPLDAEGIEVQAVHTFQDERTNITYYDGVRVDDSYRLGEVDGGVKVMASALELEHGGGFAKPQLAMVEAAEAYCRETMRGGAALIDDRDARRRLARARLHAYLSEVISCRCLWAGAQQMPNMGYGPMVKLFSSEKFLHDSRDLLDLAAPASLSKRDGPAGELNLAYRHAQGSTIYGGTSEIHRSQIAERTLGLPRTRG